MDLLLIENILFAMVRTGTPLLLVALGAMVSERAGVLNLGQEGMILVGAACVFIAAYAAGNLGWGVAAGVVAGVVGGTALVGGAIAVQARQAAPQTVAVDDDDIGGVVNGPAGPEAGVWVIAETEDFDTRFAKIVVTDDQGRYVVPDLPPANYQVWVRGYGLVDSTKFAGRPGQALDLVANAAPTLFLSLNSGNTPNLNCQSSMKVFTSPAILDQ